MIGPIEIVLVAIMIGKNPFTGEVELQYQSISRYASMSTCNVERNRVMRKPEKGVVYVCLKVDYD
jgi:hypothetical protein